MGADVDHGPVKPGIAHPWHCNQKLPCEICRFAVHTYHLHSHTQGYKGSHEGANLWPGLWRNLGYIGFMKNICAALCLCLSQILPLNASPTDGAVRIELRSGWRDADQHIAALHIHLAPGWKTYWRSPGEGGIPPQIAIEGRDVQLHWPVPQVYGQGSLQAIGYQDQVVFPLLIDAPLAGSQEVTVNGVIGVCKEICVPVEISARLTLPGKGYYDPIIGQALKDHPLTAASAGVTDVSCDIAPIRDGMRVTTRLIMPVLGRSETVILEPSEPQIWVSPSDVTRQGNILVAHTDLVPPTGKPFALSRSGIQFTVLADGRAVTWTGCSAP